MTIGGEAWRRNPCFNHKWKWKKTTLFVSIARKGSHFLSQEGTATDGGGKGGGKDNNQVTNPYKMKPKDGESLVKTINGEECTWCDKCRQWTSGEKWHTTEEHKPRSELQGGTSNTLVSNLASSGLGRRINYDTFSCFQACLIVFCMLNGCFQAHVFYWLITYLMLPLGLMAL